MKEITAELKYHKNQRIIFSDRTRFKVIAKGRRFGLTKGMANYVIEKMFDEVTPILWVDTTYSNIQRYVERYFLPILKPIPNNLWKYRQNLNELRILDSKCDFRSADKPENIEGFGYKLIVVNEAGIILRNENLWNETIRPMTLDYKAEVIIGGTPKGKKKRDGKTHLFYELFMKNPPNSPGRDGNKLWRSFQLSSYDNPLLSREEIDELAKEISPGLRDQEIYGEFIDTINESIIKKDWWNFYNESDIDKKDTGEIYQSWDTAFKTNEENDYSVCTSWKVLKDGYYLTNLFEERLEFPDLKRKVIEKYELEKPREVLIEDHASGQSLIQELRRETRIPIREIRKDRDKVSYVHAITPLIEAGRVKLPNYFENEKRKRIINQCEEFPNGEYDDIVDSMSQFLNWARGNLKRWQLEIRTKRFERKKFY